MPSIQTMAVECTAKTLKVQTVLPHTGFYLKQSGNGQSRLKQNEKSRPNTSGAQTSCSAVPD